MKRSRRAAAVAAMALAAFLALEAGLAHWQPRFEETVVLRTFDALGASQDRVVRLLEDESASWIASTHWFRSWVTRIHRNQQVQIDRGEGFEPFRAVPAPGPAARQAAERLLGRGEGAAYWIRRAAALFAPIQPFRLEPVASPKAGGTRSSEATRRSAAPAGPSAAAD